MNTLNTVLGKLIVCCKDYIFFPFIILISFGLVMSIKSCTSDTSQNSVVWKLNNKSEIGGLSPVIIGDPQIIKEESVNSFLFNGMNDGIIIPVNPVQHWKQFTVEVLFKPLSGGNPEQRFVHFQDKFGNRGLIETRLTADGKWYLDTYLHDGATGEGYTLADREKKHPCDEWFWAALVYDGKTMKHYVDGVEEGSGKFEFGPMETGMISLGVRLNQIYWFKGYISEIRFHPRLLEAQELQKRQ